MKQTRQVRSIGWDVTPFGAAPAFLISIQSLPLMQFAEPLKVDPEAWVTQPPAGERFGLESRSASGISKQYERGFAENNTD